MGSATRYAKTGLDWTLVRARDSNWCRSGFGFGRYMDVYTKSYMDGYASWPRWRLREPARILGEFQDRTRPPGPSWRDPLGPPP